MKFIKKLFKQKNSSKTLNDVIGPEIKDDPFYDELKKYAASPTLKTFLEIGSSSGQGSTEAFVSAIRTRQDKDLCSLFCMEISKPRFEQLRLTYSNDHFVKPFNLSSISPEEFPAESEIIDFYKTHKTNLNHYPVDTILGWYRQDLHYLLSNFACLNGIQYIQTSQNINQFDMVLIDGSEFTGERELSFVIGAKVIALDDTETFKCFKAKRILEKDPRYHLITHNPKVRNGFAIFEKI